MFYKNSAKIILLAGVALLLACPKSTVKEKEQPLAPLGEVPAQLLNYRFESDVPAPGDAEKTPDEVRSEAVQLDFDNNRPQEILDKTLLSPNKKRILVIYHQIGDLNSEFRLDMYSSDGKLLSKITHEEMAVHFPDTVVWSPDSNNVAFVAMVRGGRTDYVPNEEDKDKKEDAKKSTAEIVETANSNKAANTGTNAETNVNSDTAKSKIDETVEPAKTVTTFRTEQIYISDADGKDVQPLTQNEGLIYFYFIWSPDSTALAALATPITEWRIRQQRMATAGYLFVPQGRPRLVEKNGREKLLDDFPTYVQPVWSPDSTKVAVAFNKQVRIYDAIQTGATQAAIPLRNDLLISSKAFDEKIKKEEAGSGNTEANSEVNSNAEKPEANSNANTQPNPPAGALPNPNSLVSFNPIIELEWSQSNLLYLQTGYVKDMIDVTESVRSYLRWHRLVLSSQVATIKK